jgi:RNA polymerase sporulation-specific sigma factor
MTEQFKLDDLSDEQLVLAAQNNDMSAVNTLMKRYRDFVGAKVKAYFLVGADKDDLFQEGMIGLYKAVRDFKSDRCPTFKAFAGVCVSRQIITAIKTANRQKHMPLNSYVSLDKNVYEDDNGDGAFINVIHEQYQNDPEEIVINRESMDTIEYRINKTLSKLELQVLVYYLRGMNYREISDLINKDVKSVDNAIQRIKRKLEAILKD